MNVGNQLEPAAARRKRVKRPPAIGGELMGKEETCRFFGGISVAGLYRGVSEGRLPAPVKILGQGSSRWLRSECEAAKTRMIEERDRKLAEAGGAPGALPAARAG